jgi:hypothetical protein
MSQLHISSRLARRLLRFGLAGVAAAALIGLTVPAPAQSASPCPFTGTLCLFEGTGYTGAVFTASSLVPGGTCVSLVAHGWGDRAHSVINTHTKSAALFLNDNCVGGPYQVPPGTGISSLPFTPDSVWVAK